MLLVELVNCEGTLKTQQIAPKSSGGGRVKVKSLKSPYSISSNFA